MSVNFRNKAKNFIRDLGKHANKNDAEFLQRYFRTGKGQYGEGDVFIGVRVPAIRKICRVYKELSLPEIEKLLLSSVHEHRFGGVILLCLQYEKSGLKQREKI